MLNDLGFVRESKRLYLTRIFRDWLNCGVHKLGFRELGNLSLQTSYWSKLSFDGIIKPNSYGGCEIEQRCGNVAQP